MRRNGPAVHDPFADMRLMWFDAGMIRVHLLCFAAGVALTSFAVVSVQLLIRASPAEKKWFLYISENETISESSAPALWRGAEIARDCGAKSFAIDPAGNTTDTVDGTRIPLNVSNNPALSCIIERANLARLPVGLGLGR